jgi:hypothetical protein
MAGFTIEEAAEEGAAFADTVPASIRQMRNMTARIFIAFNTIGEMLSLSVISVR